MFNEATFREKLLESSGNVARWWEKLLSKRSLIRENSSPKKIEFSNDHNPNVREIKICSKIHVKIIGSEKSITLKCFSNALF